jgi:hypothetical protein
LATRGQEGHATPVLVVGRTPVPVAVRTPVPVAVRTPVPVAVRILVLGVAHTPAPVAVHIPALVGVRTPGQAVVHTLALGVAPTRVQEGLAILVLEARPMINGTAPLLTANESLGRRLEGGVVLSLMMQIPPRSEG